MATEEAPDVAVAPDTATAVLPLVSDLAVPARAPLHRQDPPASANSLKGRADESAHAASDSFDLGASDSFAFGAAVDGRDRLERLCALDENRRRTAEIEVPRSESETEIRRLMIENELMQARDRRLTAEIQLMHSRVRRLTAENELLHARVAQREGDELSMMGTAAVLPIVTDSVQDPTGPGDGAVGGLRSLERQHVGSRAVVQSLMPETERPRAQLMTSMDGSCGTSSSPPSPVVMLCGEAPDDAAASPTRTDVLPFVGDPTTRLGVPPSSAS